MTDFHDLESKCMGCTACRLCEKRKNVVFGVGNPRARVMFIGEGPGEQEDIQGEPFVGRAGQLLDKLLYAVDLDRRRTAIRRRTSRRAASDICARKRASSAPRSSSPSAG